MWQCDNAATRHSLLQGGIVDWKSMMPVYNNFQRLVRNLAETWLRLIIDLLETSMRLVRCIPKTCKIFLSKLFRVLFVSGQLFTGPCQRLVRDLLDTYYICVTYLLMICQSLVNCEQLFPSFSNKEAGCTPRPKKLKL